MPCFDHTGSETLTFLSGKKMLLNLFKRNIFGNPSTATNIKCCIKIYSKMVSRNTTCALVDLPAIGQSNLFF
jgi:hypothetical protein